MKESSILESSRVLRDSRRGLSQSLLRACLKSAFAPSACRSSTWLRCSSLTDVFQYARSSRLASLTLDGASEAKPIFKQALTSSATRKGAQNEQHPYPSGSRRGNEALEFGRVWLALLKMFEVSHVGFHAAILSVHLRP